MCPRLASTWIAWHKAKPILPPAMVREADGTVLCVRVADLDLQTTRMLTGFRSSESLSKIRWTLGTTENVVIRRVLGSWLEVGFEEAVFHVLILYHSAVTESVLYESSPFSRHVLTD